MMRNLKDSIDDTTIYLGEREGMLRYRAERLAERIERGWLKGESTKALERRHYSLLCEIESMRRAQEINDKRAALERAIRQAETVYLRLKHRRESLKQAGLSLNFTGAMLAAKRASSRAHAEIKDLTREMCDLILYG